jgi:hypothetical protein
MYVRPDDLVPLFGGGQLVDHDRAGGDDDADGQVGRIVARSGGISAPGRRIPHGSSLEIPSMASDYIAVARTKSTRQSLVAAIARRE